MKNFTVGKKILTGFLVVILMIGVILAMTVITSLQRNNDLKKVNTMGDLQREAYSLLHNFTLARVEIRSVFTSIDAEEEYNIAMEYLDACTGQLDKMEQLSGQLGGYMRDDIGTLRGMFDSLRAGLINVGENDEQVKTVIARMQESGLVMSNSSDELFENVTTISMGIAAGDADAGLDRIERVMVPTKYLGDAVDNVRLTSRALMLQQDASVVPDLMDGLDIVLEQAAAIRAVLTTEEARASVDTLTGAVEEFRTAVGEVETVLAASEAEIVTARETFFDLDEVVSNYVTTIAGDVAALNDDVAATSQTTLYILIIVGVVAVVFSVFVAVLLGRIITRPLNKMKDVMLQAGESGNLVFSEETKKELQQEAQSRDEIGQSLNAFSKFIEHVINMSDILGRVADKDLTIDVTLLSDEDTMGLSLHRMLENLNNMFGEINSIAAQVATASNEIAMGAQSLAQGSTEQASTVEEISASINEINEQMNTSNETATDAARDSVAISEVAQEGNRKMEQMMGSMHEINEASQAIGQVIKVIDDIAFQTNILALNAAVEAARAGEHGKGFAVVADEVRNLAGKSADAAKETASLISSNIEKTEQGLSYTEETAGSLTRIMDGIQQTSASLQTVSAQSEGARAATSQVNLAVDQVAQVVQQNSATSEESAAASEEMSSQAQVLQQLVAQFRLRGQGGGPRAPGPAPEDGMEEPPAGGSDDSRILF